MKGRSQCKGKVATIDKCTKPSTFEFLHSDLEHKKAPPYLGDIWVPSLLVEQNIGVKLFIMGMENLCKVGDRLTKVEHVGVTLRLLS